MAKKLYHHEAYQILEVMQQVLQKEPAAGRYATSKILCTFPLEKSFKNLALKFTSQQIGGLRGSALVLFIRVKPFKFIT